jgi:hypothetical protein
VNHFWHEFKTVHGFRKWFKTQCEIAVMKPINTEITMVHNIGVAACYYRPSERNILGYYVKTVDPQFIQYIVKFTNRLPKKFARIIEKVEAMWIFTTL